jgi:hypothetical protein
MLPPDGFPIGRLCRLFLIDRSAFRPVSWTKARAFAAGELPFSQPMEWVDPEPSSVHFPGKFFKGD